VHTILERYTPAHLGRCGDKLLAQHADLARGLAPDDFDCFEQPLSGFQRDHQQVEDGRRFVQDSQLTFMFQALDDIARQQSADHRTAQQ
jgi:hypothetical protein